jgi:hypothetical protein
VHSAFGFPDQLPRLTMRSVAGVSCETGSPWSVLGGKSRPYNHASIIRASGDERRREDAQSAGHGIRLS